MVILYIPLKKSCRWNDCIKIIGLVGLPNCVIRKFCSLLFQPSQIDIFGKQLGRDDAITAFKFEDTKPNVYYFYL